ncbi:MAG TPA: DUF488 family protein [Chitinophagaceae bacterium]|nr:DUF488 family protein [Chitinophagaceae bacterium]
MTPIIRLKRAYEKPLGKDGYWVLVDRLWPRGVAKEDAALDEWAKELAPSALLRKWYDHDPSRWTDFQQQYRSELKGNNAVPVFIEAHKDKKLITLVYGAKDTEHTHALVLQQYLEEQYATY